MSLIHTRPKYTKENWRKLKQAELMSTLESSANYILNKIKPSTFLKDLKVMRRDNSFYLVSHDYKIIIQICRKEVFKKEFKDAVTNYRQFYYVMNVTDAKQLSEEINKYRTDIINFVSEKAEELEQYLPSSEQWFRFKFVNDPLFKEFNFKYNVDFKLFIYDLLCKRYKVAIEVDGSIHKTPEQKAKDARKDELTRSYGIDIIRVRAYDEHSYRHCLNRLREILRKKEPIVKESNPKAILRKAVQK